MPLQCIDRHIALFYKGPPFIDPLSYDFHISHLLMLEKKHFHNRKNSMRYRAEGIIFVSFEYDFM